MYLNKALIVGNITRAIELKALPSGQSVATFSVATNLVYKDNQGQKKEQVEYHNIVVFGKQAEMCAQYLIKGQNVMIEGRIQTRSWDDKTSGEKKYRTEIVADRVQFGAKPQGSQSTPVDTGRDDEGFNTVQVGDEKKVAEVKTTGASISPDGHISYDETTVNLDDIPF